MQFVIEDINTENSLLTDAGMLSKLGTPNSETRICSENGDANVFRSPLTLPLTNVNTQFCAVDVAFVGNHPKTSDVKLVFIHWMMFVMFSLWTPQTNVMLATIARIKCGFTMIWFLSLFLSRLGCQMIHPKTKIDVAFLNNRLRTHSDLWPCRLRHAKT